MHNGRSLALDPLFESRPKRRKTSEQVTKMERMMRMMIIQVRPVPGVSPSEDSLTHRSVGYATGRAERRLTRHLVVSNGIRQYLCQVQEDSTSFVEDLYAWFDLEVFSDGMIKRMQCGFAVPEKVGDVKHI